jgi:hypothetical protein
MSERDNSKDITRDDVSQRRIQESRRRNREAVAKSRAKKNSRLQQLTDKVSLLSSEGLLLSYKLAISQCEKQEAETRQIVLMERIKKLEEIINSREANLSHVGK